MVELLRGLRWNWVAAVGSDDEYGRQGLGTLLQPGQCQGHLYCLRGLMPLPRLVACG